ncbi:MAG: UDP-N-acetylglucosamine pyrophosphorylase [Deltaproteobacteria bacterium]|nr:MAG: UDP-N-acetylglucosamine pyrophosphorylase [Deltaproteobacteria bacterium]
MKDTLNQSKIQQLLRKGVRIDRPETITIGKEVSCDQISDNRVVIHSGCKVYGSRTAIMSGCEIGYEGPVTIEDCQLGPDVKLQGGFFSHSTFLGKAMLGSGAHIRGGCLLEEEANVAHTVGLKQTILFPFVTLGSLINFCDCLMAGGTDRKNHSEVGSSYIHFNYTPNQDKATPSLIGDVPKGVMLNQRPIFLGGQGGLVGPVRIGYGTVIAAGTIYRKDFIKGNGLLFARSNVKKQQPLYFGLYPGIKRVITNNINYIANIIALRRWYIDVRSLFLPGNPIEKALYQGALEKIEMIISERIKRLKEVADKMPRSIELYKKMMKEHVLQTQQDLRREIFERWSNIEELLTDSYNKEGNLEKRDEFLDLIQQKIDEKGKHYIEVIKGLGNAGAAIGTEWLQGLIDEITNQILNIIPSLRH